MTLLRGILAVLVLALAGTGCAVGYGHVRPGPGRLVTAGGGGGCRSYSGAQSQWHHDRGERGTCTESYATTPTYLADSNNLLPFGVVAGVRAGYAWASIGDTSVEGASYDYFFEVVARLSSVSLGFEAGYTQHAMPDFDFTAVPFGLRLMVPLGTTIVYAGVQEMMMVDLGNAAGDGARRGQLGFMHPLPVGSYPVHLRVEGQYTSASDLDYSAFGAVGAAMFAF